MECFFPIDTLETLIASAAKQLDPTGQALQPTIEDWREEALTQRDNLAVSARQALLIHLAETNIYSLEESSKILGVETNDIIADITNINETYRATKETLPFQVIAGTPKITHEPILELRNAETEPILNPEIIRRVSLIPTTAYSVLLDLEEEIQPRGRVNHPLYTTQKAQFEHRIKVLNKHLSRDGNIEKQPGKNAYKIILTAQGMAMIRAAQAMYKEEARILVTPFIPGALALTYVLEHTFKTNEIRGSEYIGKQLDTRTLKLTVALRHTRIPAEPPSESPDPVSEVIAQSTAKRDTAPEETVKLGPRYYSTHSSSAPIEQAPPQSTETRTYTITPSYETTYLDEVARRGIQRESVQEALDHVKEALQEQQQLWEVVASYETSLIPEIGRENAQGLASLLYYTLNPRKIDTGSSRNNQGNAHEEFTIYTRRGEIRHHVYDTENPDEVKGEIFAHLRRGYSWLTQAVDEKETTWFTTRAGIRPEQFPELAIGVQVDHRELTLDLMTLTPTTSLYEGFHKEARRLANELLSR